MSNLFENLIDQTLSTAQFNNAKDNLKQIEASIPFLIGLNMEQRRTLPKMASGNLNFVQDCLVAMHNNPAILPGYMDVKHLDNDLTLFQQLDELVQLTGQLYEKLRDTQMLAGSEAYVSALAFYRMVEAASKSGLAGSDTIYDQLKERFAGQGPSKGSQQGPSDDDTGELEV